MNTLSARFFRPRLRVYYAYDLHDKVLYRVPEEMRRGMDSYAAVIASLRVLLESKQPVDDPLKRLGMLGNEEAPPKVLKQELKKVKEDGRAWLDYHLTTTVHEPKQPDMGQVEMTFRVDPDTKLLRLCRYQVQWKGQPMTFESRFDYPGKGPADVYDLGVPKTAKVVDRVPANELARILETLRAGRERMDNYRAVLIERMEGHWRPNGFPEIIYRKGDKFRRDAAIWIDPSILADPKVKWPERNKDAGDWWNKCIKDRCFLLPMSIDRGPTAYTISFGQSDGPNGSVHTQITAVNKHENQGRPGETYPALFSWMPEFACRPPMGIPHETLEPVLEQNPKEGPAGTILLRVRNIGRTPEPPSPDLPKLAPRPDAWRFWLDPARDYAVVRCDTIGSTTSTQINDKMARSPQGTWYVTQIRNKGAIRLSDGKKVDQIIDIYVDFNANLPDSLFEPPALGRVH